MGYYITSAVNEHYLLSKFATTSHPCDKMYKIDQKSVKYNLVSVYEIPDKPTSESASVYALSVVLPTT